MNESTGGTPLRPPFRLRNHTYFTLCSDASKTKQRHAISKVERFREARAIAYRSPSDERPVAASLAPELAAFDADHAQGAVERNRSIRQRAQRFQNKIAMRQIDFCADVHGVKLPRSRGHHDYATCC